jgi:D-glycero-D-manno-heptose 1,7-bisphosphate phosphatase
VSRLGDPGRERRRSAVFLDRDGVINDLVWDERANAFESPYRPEDVRLAPGALRGIESLHDQGFALVVVSNQPAAAKGAVTLAALEEVHHRVERLLADNKIRLDSYRYCHHHPEGVEPGLGRVCECRKPAPGLLLDAAAELGLDLASSWLVGDADRDVEAGIRAGCRTILIENEASQHRRAGRVQADGVAPDLAVAAAMISRFAGNLPAASA